MSKNVLSFSTNAGQLEWLAPDAAARADRMEVRRQIFPCKAPANEQLASRFEGTYGFGMQEARLQ